MSIEDRLRGYETLDLRPQPRERDPGRGRAEPRRRDRRPLRHPAALLRAQGAPARAAAPEGLRPLRAAPGSRGHDRLGRRAGARARGVLRLLAARGRHRRRLLRAGAGSTRRCGRGRRSARSARHVVPDVHPYVLMNYAGERRSVLTLAHELGHGLHGSLAQELGLLNARTPLTLAETASVFGEALTFEKLKEREDDPARAARPARRPDRRRDLDRLPADRAQPLRARDPHRAPRRGRAARRADLRALGGRAVAACSATRSR